MQVQDHCQLFQYNSLSLLHLPSIGISVPNSIGVKISRESTDDLLTKTVTIKKQRALNTIYLKLPVIIIIILDGNRSHCEFKLHKWLIIEDSDRLIHPRVELLSRFYKQFTLK